jgi:luciferase family oxidoreductase group 1
MESSVPEWYPTTGARHGRVEWSRSTGAIGGVEVHVPLSILDLAPIRAQQTASESFAASVALAQQAEESGYHRVWYAEHHNIAGIASSATSVLISHVGVQTKRIRLGAGGVMLPNHAPLLIAEQFGTLAAMYPGRIDLGLGRAPGSDRNTMYALRRDPRSADSFPQDVVELQGYLEDETHVPGVYAIPGRGSRVPLYILGSSMFGASLAAALGLPYAFASHFAPDHLEAAVAAYRREFRPSKQLDRPHVIAGVNVIAADDASSAAEQFVVVRRLRAVTMFGRSLGRSVTEAEAEMLLASEAGRQVDQMLRYFAVGTPGEVAEYLGGFIQHVGADELMVVHQSPLVEDRLRSVLLVAEAMEAAAGSSTRVGDSAPA